MSDPVLFEKQSAIGIVTFNRAQGRNSMTPELLAGFAEKIALIENDPSLRCVIITGIGRCFSAGADFRSQIQSGDTQLCPHERSYAMYKPFLQVLDIPIPVIGALNGHAVGGGFGLSLLCDIRIANSTSKYGANFAKLGLHPGLAISHLLPRLIGLPRASELLYTGRLINGATAVNWGLYNYAKDATEVLTMAMHLAEQIARNAPIAVRTTKRTLRQSVDHEIRQAAFREAFVQAETVETNDAKEGMAALLEKREPHFTGS